MFVIGDSGAVTLLGLMTIDLYWKRISGPII